MSKHKLDRPLFINAHWRVNGIWMYISYSIEERAEKVKCYSRAGDYLHLWEIE